MKRPLLCIGVSYFTALVAVSILGSGVARYLFLSMLILSAVTVVISSVFKKYRAAPLIFVAAAVALFSYMNVIEDRVVPASSLDGMSGVVYGRVTQVQGFKNDKYYYVIETERIGIAGAPQRMKIRFSSREECEVEAYDYFEGTLHFFLPEGGMESEVAKHYASDGIYMLAYLSYYDDVQIIPSDGKPFTFIFTAVRDYILNNINEFLRGDNAAVMSAIITGDRDDVSDSLWNAFRVTGTSHVLVVSGLHLSMFGGFLFKVLRFLKFKIKGASVITCIGMIIFMGITGFSPSAVRAGIMAVIFYSGYIFTKHPDGMNSLWIAVLIMCVFDPLTAQNVGFLLSVASTFGILLLGKPFGKVIKRICAKIPVYGIRRVVREILSIISTSISATLMSMPVLAYYFGRVPLIGIFTNILILNAVGVILVLGSIGAVIGGLTFAHGLAPAIFNVSNWIIDYVVSCVRTFAKFRFASVEMYFSDLVIIFGIAVVIFAILMLFTKRMSSKAMTACAGTIAALIYVFASTIMFEGTAEIRVFDAGNSTCVLLTYDGEAVMIGCGFEYDTYDKVSSVLSDKGVDGISLLVLPTYRDSECSGIVELLRNIPVDTIASGSDNIMYRKHGVKYISGDKIKFEILDGCTLMADFEDGNALTGLRLGDVDVLISSMPFSDTESMEELFDGFDILICRASVPELQEYPEYVVISDNREHGGICTTFEQGTIRILTDGENVYSMKA